MLRRFDPAGALIFSVCGLFCGQSPNPKFQASQKVMKNKVKPPFSTEKSGFRGAAGRIRTGGLILANVDLIFFLIFFDCFQLFPLESIYFLSLFVRAGSVHSTAICGWLCGQTPETPLFRDTEATQEMRR